MKIVKIQVTLRAGAWPWLFIKKSLLQETQFDNKFLNPAYEEKKNSFEFCSIIPRFS